MIVKSLHKRDEATHETEQAAFSMFRALYPKAVARPHRMVDPTIRASAVWASPTEAGKGRAPVGFITRRD